MSAAIRARGVAGRLTVVAVGCAVAATAALPDPNRPVAALAAVTAAASVAAGLLRWRLPGTLAVVAGTCTVLLAGALDPGGVRPLLVLLDAVLLVLLVAALAAAEEARERSADAAVVLRAPWQRRAGPALAALTAGAAVAATAAEDVVPSVPVVLAGLAAAVAALVVAVAGHRRP